MKNLMIRAVQLFTFLEYCNDSGLKKEILECGAGVWEGLEPLLVRFHKRGYLTHGIEISEQRLSAAIKYCQEHNMDIDLRKGDMRQLPFGDGTMSFVFSYNAIFHMNKADIATALGEIKRVLKPEGLCFVNFLSTDDRGYGSGKQRGPGEFLQIEAREETLHSYFQKLKTAVDSSWDISPCPQSETAANTSSRTISPLPSSSYSLIRLG